MIASLNGSMQHKALDHVVVDVHGVGYHVLVSTHTLAALPGVGQKVSLLCHTHVREDVLQLYGFAEVQERRAFSELITVSGVGPKLALTILSGMAVRDLVAAIAGSDHGKLRGIPGVGKRTAERLVVDLKERFSGWGDAPSSSASVGGMQEVLEALVNLGYKRSLAERALQRVSERSDHTPLAAEAALREALAVIGEL